MFRISTYNEDLRHYILTNVFIVRYTKDKM